MESVDPNDYSTSFLWDSGIGEDITPVALPSITIGTDDEGVSVPPFDKVFGNLREPIPPELMSSGQRSAPGTSTVDTSGSNYLFPTKKLKINHMPWNFWQTTR